MKTLKIFNFLNQNNSFRVSVTFDVVTQESAEHGDFAESGFEIKPFRTRSISEVLSLIEEHLGYFENFQRGANRQSLYGSDASVDYRKGENTTYAVHIDGPAKLMSVLNRKIERVSK